MTSSDSSLPPFPMLRASLRLAGVAVAGAVLAVVAVLLAGRAEQSGAVVAAAAASLLGSILALDLVRRATPGGLQRVVLASMVAFPLRLAIVAAGVALAAVATAWPVLSLVLWTLVFYLMLMGVEVSLAVAYIKDATAGSHPAPAPSLPATAKGSASHA